MNKPLIIATTAVVASGLAVTATAKWNSYMKDLQERFPDLDKKVIRKAYLRELLHALDGTYGDIQNLTDEEMDVLFLSEVDAVTKKR